MRDDRRIADAAEDATWEWFCAHHGLLMANHQTPLETLEPTLADLVSRVRPGVRPRVRFGYSGTSPVTGECYEFHSASGELLVDGPALSDEMFVAGPLRLLRLAARVVSPDHDYDQPYRDAMVRLATVAFTPQVAERLATEYLRLR